MADQPQYPQQPADFRTQFFPAPFRTAPNPPGRTCLVDRPIEEAKTELVATPLLVQCNCACK